MKILGITGPTGAGKTTVLRAVEDLGGVVIDCDGVYHRLLAESAPLRRELEARFGPLTGADGTFDRKKLGAVVFQDREALSDLNAIAHRHIFAEVERLLAAEAAGGRKLAAIDAIALLESGLGARCQATLAVTAPEEVRLGRIMARDGIDAEYARMRLAAQKPSAYFEAGCDYVLSNPGSDEGAFRARAAEKLREILDSMDQTDKTQRSVSTMEQEKTLAQQRREELMYKKVNGWDKLTGEREADLERYCADYKAFLDRGKTERDAVKAAVELAQAKGFKPFERGMKLEPGDKIYRVNRGKALTLAVIGAAPLDQGVSIGAAHIDAPRLDLKPNPLYEDTDLAYLKTHYYGGIRKYQWVTIPLELRGVVALKDGSMVEVSVGADPEDPRFTIGDLLPHLAADQSKKPLGEAIPAESLNILVGSRPFPDDEGSDRVKLAVLDLIHQKYGIVEEDFISAEIEAVPAFNATDIGFDRSLIGAYGHDDRVCAYAALAALLDLDTPRRTAVCVLADKEEIGSTGVSGMKSAAFDTFMSDLCDTQRVPLKACYEKSFCLSADVTAAFDPNFPEVYEKRNSALAGYGMGLCKYTGSRGKSGASDAGAELVAYVRRLLDDREVVWQMAELGKADQGGGGTVAAYMAERDIDTLDAGVPVLSMHAPFETVSKLDCYMTYQGMLAVFEA